MRFDHRVVLFDLDGTISDNSVGIATGIVKAMAAFDIEVSHEEAAKTIGPPLRITFPELGIAPHDVEAAIDTYREYYNDVGWAENVLYPGVPELIRELATGARTVATATSKPEPSARRILERFGLAGAFDYIGAATLDGSRDHKEDVVRHTLEVIGADPADAVMIGDRLHDIEGARRVGVHASIGVRWGFGEPGELEDAGATLIVDDISQLARALSVGGS